jgi:hypothetical protein
VEPLHLQLGNDPTALADLRRSVRRWLESLEIVERDVDAIVAASSEVAAAAIEVGPAELRGELAGGDVVVRVTGSPSWDVENHTSRYVAALLVDHVSIERSENAVTVDLRRTANRGLRS